METDPINLRDILLIILTVFNVVVTFATASMWFGLLWSNRRTVTILERLEDATHAVKNK